MRKILISILCIFIGFSAFGTGENIPTSKSYVDSAVTQKQDKIPANNGATQILMNTGTAGQIGTKNIYDSTGSYAEQTDALVTAGDFNAAVQNAIDSEFECVGWNPNDSNDCWFVQIRSAAEQSMTQAGFTKLEYIQGSGGQHIDVGVIQTANFDICFDGMLLGSGRLFCTPDTSVLCVSYYSDGVFASYVGGIANAGGIVYGGIGNRFNICLSTHRIRDYDGTERILERPYSPSASDSLWLATGRVRMYGIKIYDGTSLVFHGIPVRHNSDGTLGVYDTVSGTFFPGTGTFVAGPDANNIYLPSGN